MGRVLGSGVGVGVAFFSALAPATYLATVSAIGSSGESRSAAITFVR